MNIGKPVKHLAYLDESDWTSVLTKYSFWKDSEAYSMEYDDEHVALAYFILMMDGGIGMLDCEDEAFDHTSCPKDFIRDPEVVQMISKHSAIHNKIYGSGYVKRMGLYGFGPRGILGYHVDGPLRFKDTPYDLSTQEEWDAAIDVQSTHRTVMPLFINDDANFQIMGKRVKMTPGLLFEFSNTMPHAFDNNSDQPVVLLVTTYQAYSELFDHLP